jgi:hypothetical protein
MDLAGDGELDLVVLDGPMPGLYEHDGAEGWQLFRPFTVRLNRAMGDPNLKFVDLDGDGHADVLIIVLLAELSGWPQVVVHRPHWGRWIVSSRRRLEGAHSPVRPIVFLCRNLCRPPFGC